MLTEKFKSNYPLPEGFWRFTQLALHVDEATSQWLELHPVSPAQMDSMRSINPTTIVSGVPIYYAVIADQMWLYPEPSGEWELARSYEKGSSCRQ